MNTSLLNKVKENLIVDNHADDNLIGRLTAAAVSYAEGYQHLPAGYYDNNEMSTVTEQGIIMLASHMYESRDGGTGGFFADNVGAAEQSWRTVRDLLRMDRDWKV